MQRRRPRPRDRASSLWPVLLRSGDVDRRRRMPWRDVAVRVEGALRPRRGGFVLQHGPPPLRVHVRRPDRARRRGRHLPRDVHRLHRQSHELSPSELPGRGRLCGAGRDVPARILRSASGCRPLTGGAVGARGASRRPRARAEEMAALEAQQDLAQAELPEVASATYTRFVAAGERRASPGQPPRRGRRARAVRSANRRVASRARTTSAPAARGGRDRRCPSRGDALGG